MTTAPCSKKSTLTFASVTFASGTPGALAKTSPFAMAPLPATRTLAPTPSITVPAGSAIIGSSLASAIGTGAGPCGKTVGSKWMVSRPGVATAAAIASRNVQPPTATSHEPSVVSAVLFTTKVAAPAHVATANTHTPSAVTTRRRRRRRARAPDAAPGRAAISRSSNIFVVSIRNLRDGGGA